MLSWGVIFDHATLLLLGEHECVSIEVLLCLTFFFGLNLKKPTQLVCCTIKNYFLLSDLQGVRTYAKKDGNDWILNGSKVRTESICSCCLGTEFILQPFQIMVSKLAVMDLALHSFSAKPPSFGFYSSPAAKVSWLLLLATGNSINVAGAFLYGFCLGKI